MFRWCVKIAVVFTLKLIQLLQADEAYCIGPAPSAESYVRIAPSDERLAYKLTYCLQLRMDKIIDVCHRSGAQVSSGIALSPRY